MKDNQFFAICPNDGKIEWFELEESGSYNDSSTRCNYLKADGSIGYKNEYVRLKSLDYYDVICSKCECVMVLVPFDVCDIEERKRVFNMKPDQRVKFSERFEILDSLDD